MNSVPKIDFITALPEELSLKVLSNLTISDLAICKILSKTWKRMAEDDALMKPALKSINVTVRSKEKAVQLIKTFFSIHKKNHAPQIAMRYLSSSNTLSKWHYILYDTVANKRYFNEAEFKLNIVGEGEADLAGQFHINSDSSRLPEPNLYGKVSIEAVLDSDLVKEIETKSGLNREYLA